jgi:hypothetical protein
MAEDTKGHERQSCVVQLVRDDAGTWLGHVQKPMGIGVVAFHVGIGLVSAGVVMRWV